MEKVPFAGQLDTLVSIYKLTDGFNEVNEAVETETLLCQTKAMVSLSDGVEKIDEKVDHMTRTVYTIRRRDGLLGNDTLELRDGSQKFNVTHVRKLARTHLQLFCTAYE